MDIERDEAVALGVVLGVLRRDAIRDDVSHDRMLASMSAIDLVEAILGEAMPEAAP